MGMFSTDDKYQDRSWDWAKKWSNQTAPLFKSTIDQSSAFMQDPQSVLQNPVFNWIKQQTGGYGSQPIAQTDTYQTLQQLLSPYMNPSGGIKGSEAYQLADDLYSQQAEPLYNQLLDPLKRGIEGQYGNQVDQILSSGATGGSLASLLSQAGLSRVQSLGDTEKQLRTQDILRQDAMNQNRADALAKMIAQLQQQSFGAAGMMGQGALNIGQQQGQQTLMRDQMLSNLLQSLYSDEMSRAAQLGLSGQNARLGTATNLASGEAGGNAGMMGGLMNMGSMLGLGLGQSGTFGNMGGGITSLLGGLGGMFGGGAEDWTYNVS